MKYFIEKHGGSIAGTLSGFDRMTFRGTLRVLAVAGGMAYFLREMGILVKDFGAFVEDATRRMKEASLETARRMKRPIVFLKVSSQSKEEIARGIMEKDDIRDGLICILGCLENCRSYEVYRNRDKGILEVRPTWRKCQHLYHYWIDEVMGFMSARIQTWLPFGIQVCVNGREWLGRRMDREGMGYRRRNNCFPSLESPRQAQHWLAELVRMQWGPILDKVARRLNPAHKDIFQDFSVPYYWTAYQSEWATDLMFERPEDLASIYPQLVRGAISGFSSKDVLRFLGRGTNIRFAGEVTSEYRKRPEGICVKHRVNGNSIKMYDKEGSVLRVETTLNNPRDVKVYRKNGKGQKAWMKMRKSVADIGARAEVSQAANDRYLDALSALETESSVREIVTPLCRPVRWKGNRVRALRPWSREDNELLQAVCHGEYLLRGFRNRDLASVLFPEPSNEPEEKRRLSARITHKIRVLRAHGLIRKISGTRRYIVTKKGRTISTAIFAYQDVSPKQLAEIAA